MVEIKTLPVQMMLFKAGWSGYRLRLL